MLKIKENDIVAHCITGREYLVTSISENKSGQRVVELIGHKCNIVREIRTDENGDEYILDEVKLTGGVVEEVRIVPAGNKFTLEVLYNCSELLYTDKEHEAKVFMFIDGIHKL